MQGEGGGITCAIVNQLWARKKYFSLHQQPILQLVDNCTNRYSNLPSVNRYLKKCCGLFHSLSAVQMSMEGEKNKTGFKIAGRQVFNLGYCFSDCKIIKYGIIIIFI